MNHHGDLVEVGEQGLHDRVFETELRISLLAVLRRPRGEHLILEKYLLQKQGNYNYEIYNGVESWEKVEYF